ncbi:MAG: energy-coupling factor transporter transmembrane protein EcfT, partial [Clostridiales bacterium]|nr:energy-coupling factor transporter transmembrane protein EcfT [Clostridiales bacterium]
TPLVSWGIIKIYKEGLLNAAKMALRLIFLVLGPSLLTLTTTPVELTDGLESLLKPLALIKLPVHELAIIMSIALRLIPTLTEETEKIMNAQKSRCADFDTGNIFKRAKALLPILIPLFVGSF